jgi:hypothetical protein
MKKAILFTLLAIFALSLSVSAQNEQDRYSSSRLTTLSNQLKRQTVDLADRTSESIRRGYGNSRSDIEAAFTATQMDASAGLFQQIVSDNSNASQLRDAASILSDIARRSPSSGSNSSYWRDIQRSIDDINREIGGNSNGGGWGNGNGGNGGGWGNDNGGGNINNALGKARWRGTVDKEVHLILRNNNIQTDIFDGQDYGAGTYNFTSALPNSNVQVYVNKKKGRGNVTVIQQPDRGNNFTTIIKVLDEGSGAKEYDVEVYWTR